MTGIFSSQPGTASYIYFNWKMIILELSSMITKAVLLIWVLPGNRTSDGTPLKREFKSLGSVSLTELYR